MSWAASVLASSSAFAGKIAFSEACWKVVDQNHYLIRPTGEGRTSDASGARLWNLDKLTQDWSLGRGGDSDCTQAIYKQAVADGNEYWTGVGQRHHCDDPAFSPKDAVCTRKYGYRDNQSYLKVVKTVLELPEGHGCLGEVRGKATQSHEEAHQKLVKAVVPAVQKALSAQTADPEEKATAEATTGACTTVQGKDHLEKALALASGGCLSGLIHQFVTEVWDLVSGAAHVIAHPIDTVSSLAEFVSELRRNPQGIAKQIADQYVSLWPSAACQDPYDIGEAVCKIATKAFFDIGLTVTGVKTVKITADIVKLITKNAVKLVGKPVLATGKAVAKVTPKFIKGPISKVATPIGTKAANAVDSATKAVTGAATNSARIAALKLQNLASRTGAYVEATKTGQTVLKVKDRVLMAAETRAGKVFIKFPAGIAKFLVVWPAKRAVGLYTANIKTADQMEAKIQADEAHKAELTKYSTIFADKFNGITTCAEAEKAHNELVAQYKFKLDDPKGELLNTVYVMALTQLPNNCQ